MTGLSIDTSDNRKITIGLGSKTKTVKTEVGFIKAEACLPIIDKLCKEENLSILDIKKISVNAGPGSFTGLRVGVSIANALGYLLKIPVNGKKIGRQVFPVYN